MNVKFDSHWKLHHSQTIRVYTLKILKFDSHWKLHHSQT